jgi:hypothetical protein
MKEISYKKQSNDTSLNITCLILLIPALVLICITASFLGMFDYAIILNMIP